MELNELTSFVKKCNEEEILDLKKSDFNEIELMVGVNLPVEFISYYLENNGGDSKPDECFYFFPIKYAFSIEKKMNIFFKDTKKMPFASDGCGYVYVLSFENDSYGQVLVVTYTQSLEKRYVFIANSFEEFIKHHVKKGNRGFHFTEVDFNKISNDLDKLL